MPFQFLKQEKTNEIAINIDDPVYLKYKFNILLDNEILYLLEKIINQNKFDEVENKESDKKFQ